MLLLTLLLLLLLVEMTVERLDDDEDMTDSAEVRADVVLLIAVVTVFILADMFTDMAGTESSV